MARINDNGVERDMTADELAAYEATVASYAAEQAAALDEQAARDKARKSAVSKLAALGLTDTEIAALLGG
jgi:hypothetical protein